MRGTRSESVRAPRSGRQQVIQQALHAFLTAIHSDSPVDSLGCTRFSARVLNDSVNRSFNSSEAPRERPVQHDHGAVHYPPYE